METIMKIIVVVILIIWSITILRKKNKYELILDYRFWIFAPWIICMLLYFFSGIQYEFNLNIFSFGYILIYWICFFARNLY